MAKAENVVQQEEGWETLVQPFGETFPFEEDGDTLTGEFVNKKMVEQEDLNNPGNTREAPVYEIVSAEDGKLYSVWGSYALEEAFNAIEPGKTVRIIYHGKTSIDGGRRSVKKFTVQVKAA